MKTKHDRLHAIGPARIGLAGGMLIALVLTAGTPVLAQPVDDSAERMAAQRQAMEKVAFLDGLWRGTAVSHGYGGKVTELIQTERVGTIPDGTVRVIEGRGFDAEGHPEFSAFAVLSWDTERERYRLHTHAGGRSGDYDLELTESGFAWERPAGEAKVRFEARVDGDTWHQTGHYLPVGGEPVQILEMHLQRFADTAWPAEGALGPAD